MVQKYQALVYTVCHQLVPDEGEAQDLTPGDLSGGVACHRPLPARL